MGYSRDRRTKKRARQIRRKTVFFRVLTAGAGCTARGCRFVNSSPRVLYAVCRILCDWNFHVFSLPGRRHNFTRLLRAVFPSTPDVLPILRRTYACVLRVCMCMTAAGVTFPFIFESRETPFLSINKPPHDCISRERTCGANFTRACTVWTFEYFYARASTRARARASASEKLGRERATACASSEGCAVHQGGQRPRTCES